MAVISSRSNPTIQRIRSLRRRAERERTDLFFVEGLRCCRAAIEAGIEIESLVLAPAQVFSESVWPLVDAYRSAGGRILQVTPGVFHGLSTRDRPHGLALVGRRRWQSLPACVSRDDVWVALSGVQNPGNLGTVVRTGAAAGIAGLILLGPTVDPYDPAALRASMGTLFSQRVIRAEPDEFVSWARRSELRMVGTSGDGGRDYRSIAYDAPLVLLLGAERQGLPADMLTVCDTVAHVPMLGGAGSLNLGVAAGILLYEAKRRRLPVISTG
jgi:TrmH family RNA methyltransferase